MASRESNWTREQTLAALHLYFQLPFSHLDAKRPKVKQLGSWIGRTANAVALKLTNLASLDPLIRASGRRGMGNASRLDKRIWGELHDHWDAVALEAAAAYERLAVDHGLGAYDDVKDELAEFAELPEGKTRTATVQVRVNQARFRKAVLTIYGGRCCISGLSHPKLLIASHIVPWHLDRQNRLNPHNGLCLSALHDKAFDQGLLTVMSDFTVRVHDQLLRLSRDRFLAESVLAYHGKAIRKPEKCEPSPEFLESHARRHGFI